MVKFTEIQEDALKEVAHIGAGSASTALSQMTGRSIMIETTKISVMSISKTTSLFEAKEKEVVGTVFQINGDLSGSMISLSTKSTAMAISDMVRCCEIGTTKRLDYESEDVIKEVGNILIGAYLAALSDMSGLNMIESTPKLVIGPTPKIVGIALDGSTPDQEVIVIETRMSADKHRFVDDMIMVLRPETLERLLSCFISHNACQ